MYTDRLITIFKSRLMQAWVERAASLNRFLCSTHIQKIFWLIRNKLLFADMVKFVNLWWWEFWTKVSIKGTYDIKTRWWVICCLRFLKGCNKCVCCLRLTNVQHGNFLFTCINSVLLVLIFKSIYLYYKA